MIDETLFDAEEKMEKAVSVARDDLASIRTGRANPAMFNRITVDYYGSPTPITQLSSRDAVRRPIMRFTYVRLLHSEVERSGNSSTMSQS